MDDFEAQLKRRMQMAQQQGWSNDEVQRSALIERGLHQQQQAQQPQQPQQSSRGGWGSFALSLLPGGSLVDKAMHHEHIGLGDVATEAALTALPFGLGRVAEVARGARGATELFRGAKAAGTAARGADATVVTAANRGLPQRAADLFKPRDNGPVSSTVTNAGGSIRATNRGIVPGATIEGSTTRLRPQQAADINDFLDNTVKARGSVSKQVQQVESFQQRAAQAIDAAASRDNKVFTPQDLQAMRQRINGRIAGDNGQGIAGFDPKLHKGIVNAYDRQLGSVKDTQGLLNFKRSLDQDAINYGRNSNAPDPIREQIAQAFRREANDHFGTISPAARQASQLYAKSEDALNGLIRRANPAGVKPFGTSVNNQGLGGKLIQNNVDRFGRAVQTTGRVASSPLGAQAVARAPFDIHTLFAGGGNQQQDGSQQQLPGSPQLMFQNPQSMDEQALNAVFAGGAKDFNTAAQGLSDYQSMLNGDGGGGAQGGQQGAGQPSAGGLQYSSMQLANAAQNALLAGDMKSYQAYADAADQASKIEAAQAKANGGSGLNVSKVTAQQYGLAQTGLQSVQQLKQMLQQDPGVLTRTATPGRSLPIVGGYISNAAGTGSYDAIGYNIADAILRLRTGATANESEVRALQSQIMPRAGDSAQTQQTKMQQIEQIFNGPMQLAQRGGGSQQQMPDDITQLMAAYGY